MQNASTIHPLLAKSPEWLRLNKEYDNLRLVNRPQLRALSSAREDNYSSRQNLLSWRISSFPEELQNQRKLFQEDFCSTKALISRTPTVSALPLTQYWDRISAAQIKISSIYPLMPNEDDGQVAIVTAGCGDAGAPAVPVISADAQSIDVRVKALEASASVLRNKIEEALGPDVMTSYASLQEIAEQIEIKYTELKTPSTTKNAEIQAFVSGFIGKEANANWAEQEADEVGFELYLRAGFSPLYFTWLEETVLKEKLNDCRQQIDAIRMGCSPAPFRGEESHPGACWRLYDIQVYETQKHATDYAPLLSKATQIDVFDNELIALKNLNMK